MAERNPYHSFVAAVRRDNSGFFVRILDRYYPGPPGPEYTTVLPALDPHEARALAAELVRAAAEAEAKETKHKLEDDIRRNTLKIIAEARAET